MSERVDHFIKRCQETQSCLDGVHWVPAKAYPAPFWWRVRDAMKVLSGKAVAVTFDFEEANHD